MPSDGLFNVLIVLTRTLVRLGPKSREDLLAVCGSGTECVDSKQLTQTLNRWTDLCLFGSEDGLMVLREPYRSQLGRNADVAETRLPRILRGIALAEENNRRFWESEDNKSADLSRGLSWILAQDAYTLDTSSHAKIAALESSQVADHAKRIFQNDTRWNGLRTWMVYLGFARNGTQVTIDPTEALRDSLPDIFGTDQTISAQSFVERAAGALPVLDHGTYRLQIEDVLKDSNWSRPPDTHLSSSFSRALQRLEREGAIAPEQRSDAEGGITLIGTNQRQWRRMTHVRRLPSRKSK